MLRIIWSLAAVGGAIYVGLFVYLYATQSAMVYFPERELITTPDDQGLNYETVHLITTDGFELHGWFLPAQNARGTLLFLHGNAGNISHRLDSLALFHQLSLNVFIFDYRGYGQSQGKPTEQGTYLDAEAAWNYLVEKRNLDPHRIVVFGRSLGGAVASKLASQHQPAALVLESTFRSAPAMARRLMPIFPARLISRYKYDSEANLRHVHCPVLIAHSQGDDIIPYKEGRKLFEAANEPKQFLELRGNHNSGFLTTGQAYQDGLQHFLDRYL
jgi:fermentation-respiration switch protein FrsA (DUF1100 family)